ncbi:MAG TPA: YicC family protein [Flavonifractor plautii]|nr:YicC family protein [Flavonifractor plautii]
MVKSMTGYGRGEAVVNGRPITVEVRSVNNRYLDCSVKLPRVYVFAEDAIKTGVQGHISRGKVDVFVTIGPSEEGDTAISVNKPLADGYYAALCQLRDSYGLKDDISVSLLSRFPDVFLVERTQEDLEAVSADICSVLEQALSDFDAMRVREGEKLCQDVLGRADTIEGLTARVEERSPGIVADYRARLTAKLNEVLQNTQLDEGRVLTEAAIYADKVAVVEETVRLRSHLSQLRHMLGQGGAIGRKLDFLIQEFNREANTIGSKCNDIETAGYVVDIKAEIEKIREQIQNIE